MLQTALNLNTSASLADTNSEFLTLISKGGHHMQLCTILKIAAVCNLIFATSAFGQTEVEKARLARTMWSAFECSQFAAFNGDSKEAERLFNHGLESGRAFFKAVDAKEISADVLRKEVPIGVNFVAQGPTVDFIIGRIFENAKDDAYEEIVKKDNGSPLDPDKWIFDKKLQAIKGSNAYLKGNCVLIK